MRTAVTRGVSDSFASCQLTHLPRQPIDVALARLQHAHYEHGLQSLGCRIVRLPARADLADSVFIEDTAVVLDEVAIVTRPGAESRRDEVADVERVLSQYRNVGRIESPGTLDGGDILRLGRMLFAGVSSRTNAAGLDQLGAIVAPWGYGVAPVVVTNCLHLKSAVTAVGRETLLLNPTWVDVAAFGDVEVVTVDPAEPLAGNALLVGGTIVYPTIFPRTLERLVEQGLAVWTVDVSELAKAEGGVTCCCLLVEGADAA